MEFISVLEVKQVRVGTLEHEVTSISKPEDAYAILRDYLDEKDREHFVVLLLDTKNKVNAIHTVSIGGLNAAIVTPREVYKVAILHNAAGIILCHNHPSGDPKPSQEDIVITDRLCKAGELLGIEVLDHIVIGSGTNTFCSFKKEGHM